MSVPVGPVVLLPMVLGARLALSQAFDLVAALTLSVAIYAVLATICVAARWSRGWKEDRDARSSSG
jgi:hypothetical protein